MQRSEQAIIELIKSGIQAIIPEEELVKKLSSGKKLKIKLGMDPTASDLHLGHVIVLQKLRQFQDLGHEIILIIGDFTARIGDPTGKSKTRPPLTHEQIAYNTATYFNQVHRILNSEHLTICYNSTWLDQLTASDMVSLCAKVTVAQLIERDDFSKRLTEHTPIGFHELLYPLFQGYDSVVLHADVELGGTDQTFNLLMGRHLQQLFGQEPQVIITTPLLEGLSGDQKMSKSLGNSVGLTEPAWQAFGKIMSISDDRMWHYYAVLLAKNKQIITELQSEVAQGITHPMVLKKKLAHEIIQRFWSAQEADEAQTHFEAVIQNKDYSHAIPMQLPDGAPETLQIIDLLKLLQAVKSSSEARRLIEGHAVKVDNVTITNIHELISWRDGMYIKVGKHRIYKLTQ